MVVRPGHRPRRHAALIVSTKAVLGGHRPEVWVFDRYAGQQNLAPASAPTGSSRIEAGPRFATGGARGLVTRAMALVRSVGGKTGPTSSLTATLPAASKRRFSILQGLTADAFVRKIGTTEPQRFRPKPSHDMPGANMCQSPRLISGQRTCNGGVTGAASLCIAGTRLLKCRPLARNG